MLENVFETKKHYDVDSNSAASKGETIHTWGEAKMEGTLVLFESNKGGESEMQAILTNCFHPSVSDWVVQKAMEIKHCVGITCMNFEDEFMALLTTIKAGNAQSKSNPSHNSAKKGEENLRGLYGQ